MALRWLSNGRMKKDGKTVPQLESGQLWRVKRRYVLIVALENLCVRFKLMDAPNQTEERTLKGECDTLWRYLLSRNGQFIQRFPVPDAALQCPG
jgi:hypothetical protein